MNFSQVYGKMLNNIYDTKIVPLNLREYVLIGHLFEFVDLSFLLEQWFYPTPEFY